MIRTDFETPFNQPDIPGHEDGTRSALMDAAERLFAEKGVDATSVRDITGLAHANLGAINYYFGTKDRLVMEVFIRRVDPIDQQRMSRLDQLKERTAAGQGFTLEEVLEAYIEPVMHSLIVNDAQGYARLKLLNRCFHEMNPELKRSMKKRFDHIGGRFDAAIRQAVPGLPERDSFWLMTFTIGSMVHMLSTWTGYGGSVPGVEDGLVAPEEGREITQWLITFAAAGIRASAGKYSPAL